MYVIAKTQQTKTQLSFFLTEHFIFITHQHTTINTNCIHKNNNSSILKINFLLLNVITGLNATKNPWIRGDVL